MNTNKQYGRVRGKSGPIGIIVSSVATGIGLISEGIQHHKEKKAAANSSTAEQLPPAPSPATYSILTIQKSSRYLRKQWKAVNAKGNR
jgi:hypothetical protein